MNLQALRSFPRYGEKRRELGIRLLLLASQDQHDVSQSDAEVVFLGGLKHREIQLAPACEHSHHCHSCVIPDQAREES